MVGTTVKLLQKLKLKKLNTDGVAHHALIAVLVVMAIATFGAYRVFYSHAQTASSVIGTFEVRSDKDGLTGCWLAGRVYDASATEGDRCKDKCRITGTEFVAKTSTRPAYCKGHVNLADSTMTIDRCTDQLHRWWVKDLGCAKKADQENQNTSKLCPDTNFPNYVAETNTDKCIATALVNTGNDTPGTQTGGGDNNTTVKTDPMSWANCDLLGRLPGTTADTCKQACKPGAGVLLTRNSVIYCDQAVAPNLEAVRCSELHRKWLQAGCARRPDQQDTNAAPQCVAGYPYYNANFTPPHSDGTLVDVCEIDAKHAADNEQNSLLGGVILDGTKLPAGPTDSTCQVTRESSTVSSRCIVNPPSGGTPGTTTPEGTTYKITLYKDKDFKGSSMEVTSTVKDNTVTMKVKIDGKDAKDLSSLSKLPAGWNDKISSYKIQSGQWQLCPEANYEGSTKVRCAKVYAGDPQLSDKLNDAISSLRLVTSVTYEEITADDTVTEAPQPICINEQGTVVLPDETGKCPEGSNLTCLDEKGIGIEYHHGECQLKTVEADAIVPVDKRFKGKDGQKKCELLGREWIEKAGKKDINGGQYGCSTETCKLTVDGRPRHVKQLSPTGPRSHEDTSAEGDTSATVCVSYKFDAPYAVKMDSVKVTGKDGKELSDSKQKCDALGRVWIDQVNLCAQIPNRKDKNQTVVNADQCASNKKDSYYIFKDTKKNDECFSPSYIERAKSVAKSTGGVLNAALQQGPRAYCSTVKSGNYHWDKSKKLCVIDRQKCWNGQSIPVTQQCPPKPAPTSPSNNTTSNPTPTTPTNPTTPTPNTSGNGGGDTSHNSAPCSSSACNPNQPTPNASPYVCLQLYGGWWVVPADGSKPYCSL